MATQWRTGGSGVIGLDYTALPTVMQLVGVPEEERLEVFSDVRIMEDAALEKIRSTK